MLYLFAVVYGIGHGGHFTLISPLVAEHFGIRSHGVLFGIVLFAGTVGGAAGPILAGHLFDITGSYGSAFWICAAFGYLRPGTPLVAQARRYGLIVPSETMTLMRGVRQWFPNPTKARRKP